VVKGTIPVQKLYEDEYCLSFKDINPVAPVHALVIPKTPIGGIGEVTDEHEKILGHLLVVANKVAKDLELRSDKPNEQDKGFRLIINEGKHGQQSIRWLHIHIIG